MFDFIKLHTRDQDIICRIKHLPGLILDSPKQGYERYKLNNSIQLQFRRVFAFSQQLQNEYSDLYILIRPHYFFNGGKHNANDFSPKDCINVFKSIFDNLGITNDEFLDWKLTSIEFGINLITNTDVRKIIENIFLWHRKEFKKNRGKFSIISLTSKYKQLKIYSKSSHCIQRLKMVNVPINILRVELKSKDIKKFYKMTISDLLNEATYHILAKKLFVEFQNLIIIETNLQYNNLNKREKQSLKLFLIKRNWLSYINSINKNLYNTNRKKYDKILMKTQSTKAEVLSLMLTKFKEFEIDDFSYKSIYV